MWQIDFLPAFACQTGGGEKVISDNHRQRQNIWHSVIFSTSKQAAEEMMMCDNSLCVSIPSDV